MFDNPKKELKELEGQLLAAEMNHEPAQLDNASFEELYDEILEEFGPKKTPEAPAQAVTEPPIRNFANGYGSQLPEQEEPDAGEPIPEVEAEEEEPQPVRKSGKGLVILACLECIGIAAVAAYWVLHFM